VNGGFRLDKYAATSDETIISPRPSNFRNLLTYLERHWAKSQYNHRNAAQQRHIAENDEEEKAKPFGFSPHVINFVLQG
jgi:hypothetical protein